jgi:glycosyltransferase involved in cell wall biosynthesis
MKRIKLLYLIDQLNIGGTEKQLLAVLERLDRSKFDPYLVCLRPTEYLEQCSVDCHKKVLNVTSLASWDGLQKICSFVRYLKQEKIDIVQTFFFDSTVFGVLAARLAGVKCVLSSRRDMGFWYAPATLSTLFFLNMLTHRIVVNSEAIKENVHLREHVKRKKIDVIYNGIDLDPFSVQYNVVALRNELGIPVDDQVVGIVANLNRRVKRVDIFIDTAVEILKKKENVSFVIVGEGQYSKELKEQTERLGLTAKIHFTGSQENVIPYLQLFDVGLLTSESEGFANAIVEYMAAGLPVICFDSGGNRELIENNLNGFLVGTKSPRIIADRILSLTEDGIRNKMKAENLKRVMTNSWDVVIREIELFYLSSGQSGLKKLDMK